MYFGLETKNNWRIFGGIDYAQLVTRFQNNDQEIIDGTLPNNNQEYIDPNNALQVIEGTLTTSSAVSYTHLTLPTICSV